MNSIYEDNEIEVDKISKNRYEYFISHLELQIKGKSKYDDYWLISDYLPNNKKFYVLEDYEYADESGSEEWCFVILTKYKKEYLLISCAGGN